MAVPYRLLEPLEATRAAVRRVARGCGVQSLTLSLTAHARRQLRAVLTHSTLSIREFSCALGVSSRTVERHLANGKISRERRDWYNRLEAVYADEHTLTIVVRRVAPPRKPAAIIARPKTLKLVGH